MIAYNNSHAWGTHENHEIYGPLSNCSDAKREQIKNARKAHAQQKAKYYKDNKL
jgi:hypothetical protein